MDPIYSKLDEIISSAKCWECKLLFNTADDPEVDCNEIDICEVLNSSTPYSFPQRFDGSHNKLKLITELKIAALKAGFVLAQRSAKSSKQLRKGLGAYITLQCQHGAVFRPRLNLKKYVTHTHQSKVSSDKCPFAFNISMTSEDDSGLCAGRWHIHSKFNKFKLKAAVNGAEHSGHFKLHASCLRSSFSMMKQMKLN